MRWVRTNRRFGAWCALAAIVLQAVLSFGHAHRDGFRSGGLLQVVAVKSGAQAAAAQGDPASPPAGPALEYCAICAAINMGASAVPPQAPGSSIRVVVVRPVRFAPRADAAGWTLAHELFQARGPPFV